MASCQLFKNPQQVSAYTFLDMYMSGVSMRLQDDFGNAAQRLEACLQIQPYNSQVHYQLACLRNQMNQPTAAFYHAVMAFRLQPNQIEYARCLESTITDRKQHLRVLKDLCRRFPNDVAFRDKFFMSAIKQGAFNQALEECREWNLKNGSDPQTLCIQAGLLKTLRRYNEALIVLETASQNFPGDIPVWIALAESYERINDSKNLVRVCNSILKIQPNSAKALAILMIDAIRVGQNNFAEGFYQDFLQYCNINEWNMLYVQLESIVSKEQLQQKWILPYVNKASDLKVKADMQYKAFKMGLPYEMLVQWMYQDKLTASTAISFLQQELEKRQSDSLYIHSKYIKQQFPELSLTGFYQIRACALLNRLKECSEILNELSNNANILDTKKKGEHALWSALYHLETHSLDLALRNLKQFKELYPEHALGFLIECIYESLRNNEPALNALQQAALSLWTKSDWDIPFNVALEYLSQNAQYDAILQRRIQHADTDLRFKIMEQIRPHAK